MNKASLTVRYVLVVVLNLLFLNNAYSVGAYPFVQEVVQPNGTSINMLLHGDEWYNWASTEDGYRMARNENGVFEYVTVTSTGEVLLSGIAASNPDTRSNEALQFLENIEPGPGVSPDVILQMRDRFLKPQLKSTSVANAYPSFGERKLLVILANFSDTQPSYTQSQFNDYMNLTGYNGTGSFRDYYLEVSGGRLTIVSVVTQWVQLPNIHDYYGPQEKWGEFAYEAVKAASNAGVDFSQFDNTGDGVVEGVAIIHQGPGQEVTGNVSDIWSHAWSLRSAGYSVGQRRFNGVLVDRYTAQPETRNKAGDMNTIGVIAHEFGHNLGLPDYYDTSGNGFVGTGRWDIMASGTYNGSPAGSSPAHHNAFSKIELGWANEVVLIDGGRKTLSPVIPSETVYRINSPVAHEYLLLENRQKILFDSYLPGSGMLVYHVDENKISQNRGTNSINTEAHQGLYPLAAGGTINAASAVFPGTLNKTELTDETTPATITWTGEPFNRSITGVYVDGSDVVFDFMAIQNGSPLTLDTEVLSPFELKVNWTPSINSDPVLLVWSADGVFGIPEDGKIYLPGDLIQGGGIVLYVGDMATSFQHDGLNASTTYYYSIWSKLDATWSPPISASGTTDQNHINDFPWVESFETGLSQWRQVFINGDYSWKHVDTGIHQKPEKAFDGVSFAQFFVNSFNEQRTMIVSPLLNLQSSDKYILSFRHVQHEWDGDQDKLKVLVKTETAIEWEVLAFYEGHEDEWVQRKIVLPYSEPVRIAFEGYGNYGYGVGVDYVEVKKGADCSSLTNGIANATASNVTQTGMQLNWSAIDAGAPVLILARKSKKVIDYPESGVKYTAGSEFGIGQQIGNDTYVVYDGAASEFVLTNLNHSSDYYFAFYTYGENYCYTLDVDQFVFSTETKVITQTIEVRNDYGVVEGAKLLIGSSEYITGSDGLVTIITDYSELYMPLSVSYDGFYNKWDRFIPNESRHISYLLKEVIPMGVSEIAHQANYKTVNLSWNPVVDEKFDGYEPFSLTLAGWSMIDYDGSSTYSLSGLTFPNQGYKGSFIVLDPYSSGLLQADFDMTAYTGKQLLAAFAAVDGPNDDWLISPSFVVNANDIFSFTARSITNIYGLEQIQVLIKAENGEFTLISEGSIEVPLAWTQYAYALSDYAGQKVNIAVRYVSDDVLALLIDNIRISSVEDLVDNDVLNGVSESEIIKAERFYTPYKSSDISQMMMSSGMDLAATNTEVGAAIGYTVMHNGLPFATIPGFSNTSLDILVSDCKNNTFTVRSEYLHYSKSSAWSDPYLADACYSVVFNVSDIQGSPMEGVKVIFGADELITGSAGSVVFSGLDELYGVDYYASKDEYVTQNGSVDVTSNLELDIAMANITTGGRNKPSSTEYHVYPIPASTELFIEGVIDGEVTVLVYDYSGRLLYNADVTAENQIMVPLSGFQSGLYLLKVVRNDSMLLLRKIAVEK